MHELLAILSGVLVGFSLGLVGGGGSILAVPLLMYVVGLADPHTAIGTSALAVAATAFANLALHARAGTVKWPCAATFAVAGLTGALIGAFVGKRVDGDYLLLAFAVVMVAVGISMLRPKAAGGDPSVRIDWPIARRLVAIGFVTGLLAGFFGIGGGFLIVPGIMLGSGMPVLNAVGSSLFSVGVFGAATAFTYALSDLVEWKTAALFVIGGGAAGFLGRRAAERLSAYKGALNLVFAAVIFVVAAYMLLRGVAAIA
ncbi:MAG: sulfite exporter TauE/SafE family protein [Alphaproteobacteria bacterium]|nr:sulfite exporter TauE/SafE family protein [Alphaproteobacteria bacterium]